jgi:hypothetical protein
MQGGQCGVVLHEQREAFTMWRVSVSLLLHLIVGSVGFPVAFHVRMEAMCG